MNLENEIIATLNNYDFTFEIKAGKPYDFKPANLVKPLIIIQRIYSKANDRTFTDKEEYEEASYQVTVLSRIQKDIFGNTIQAYDVVGQLSEEVAELLYNRYLMKRQGDFAIKPLSDDNTVLMCAFRVNAMIDLTHEYLYTR